MSYYYLYTLFIYNIHIYNNIIMTQQPIAQQVQHDALNMI